MVRTSTLPKSDMERSGDGARQAARRDLLLQVVRATGEVRLGVTGASMLPALWPENVVVVHPQCYADLQPGQVIVFFREDRLVPHRIVHVQGDQLITCGDSVPRCDPPVSASDIVGRVVAIERNGRRISPAQSPWQRAGAAILRRSELCIRVLLFVRRRWRRAPQTETAWAR